MVNTESEAMQEILTWSRNIPVWQKDALRRLISSSELLSNKDIIELTELCKNSKLQNDPLASKHVTAQNSDAPTVRLKALRNVQNVNALADKQSLSFEPKGVTLIYGDNGAGKSGYARILKSACRARWKYGRADEILANIYKTQTGNQHAEIQYYAGAQELRSVWTNDTESAAQLSEVSVFDTRTANVQVEDTNDLAYTPFPMKLLERLVLTCNAVKEKLQLEIRQLEEQTPQCVSTPDCSKDTNVGQVIETISRDTDKITVSNLASLSEEEKSRLANLKVDFTQEPKVAAKTLWAQRDRLKSQLDSLQDLIKSVSNENIEKLKSCASDFNNKQEAAYVSSKELFEDETLKGVGSEVWLTLWNAARAYSEQKAYPGMDFPVEDDGAHCVLCQQELDKGAINRMKSFENFIQGKIHKEKTEAKQALDNIRTQIIKTSVSMTEILKARCFLGDELDQPDLANELRRVSLLLMWRRRLALRSNGEVITEMASFDENPLNEVMNDLENRAGAFITNNGSDKNNALEEEFLNLEDRQWLADNLNDVTDHIDRLIQVDKLQTALQDTQTNFITRQNTTLSEALITDRLRDRFIKEIELLKLAGLKIKLEKAHSRQGVSRFRVSLNRNSSNNAGDVLSEGEYRCVAFAGFMAELATNDSGSGIILDDPVSSLDHRHREAIAQRLAKEGQTRQVIVFTHDLPFLNMLRDACTQMDDPKNQTNVELKHIQKKDGIPGYCYNEAPSRAKHATTRLESMLNHLEKCRYTYDDDPDSYEWLINAKGLIADLRQTWEKATEDAVSPVLKTFSSKVDTKGFEKLAAIRVEDAQTMRKHYRECSVLLHMASEAMNPTAPTPDEINDQLQALKKWINELTKRQMDIAKQT